MSRFVMLTTLTEEGRKTLKAHPERLREVNKEVEAMGAKPAGSASTRRITRRG